MFVAYTHSVPFIGMSSSLNVLVNVRLSPFLSHFSLSDGPSTSSMTSSRYGSSSSSYGSPLSYTRSASSVPDYGSSSSSSGSSRDYGRGFAAASSRSRPYYTGSSLGASSSRSADNSQSPSRGGRYSRRYESPYADLNAAIPSSHLKYKPSRYLGAGANLLPTERLFLYKLLFCRHSITLLTIANNTFKLRFTIS